MHVVSFVEEGDFEFVGEVADVGFSLDWVVWEGGGVMKVGNVCFGVKLSSRLLLFFLI